MPHSKGELSDEFKSAVVETELQQKLSVSEHIASIFSWGTFDGIFLWVMMEFCEHGDLTSHILKSIIPSLRYTWIEQLSHGLQHMHHLNVIHRDIKSDNILVTSARNGETLTKYIDFGLAVEVTDSLPCAHGRSGTPGYMAPEVDARLPYTCVADVWSLGVVFFQMHTCVPAHEVETNRFLAARAKMNDAQDAQTPSAAAAYPEIEERNAALLDRMLLGDPASRLTACGLVSAICQYQE